MFSKLAREGLFTFDKNQYRTDASLSFQLKEHSATKDDYLDFNSLSDKILHMWILILILRFFESDMYILKVNFLVEHFPFPKKLFQVLSHLFFSGQSKINVIENTWFPSSPTNPYSFFIVNYTTCFQKIEISIASPPFHQE